ncbi:MAG: hypothetical protein U0M12_09465 [Acutalibacteraceae bacterium]|nr:hypothetical protein [Acutalibacteraceae bacterium]
MSVYSIAEINIKITTNNNYVTKKLKPYLSTNSEYAFAVEATKDDILYEKSIAEEYNADMCEFIAIFRKICRKLLTDYNGILMHSASILYKGKGYIFTAPSGTGKTTHIRLWKKYFGDKVEFINGDKPVLRNINSKIYVYGTPWQGKEDYGNNIKAPLAGIFLLQRGKENSVEKATAKESISFLLAQTLRYQGQNEVEKLLAFIENIVVNIPVYKLKCNMEMSAVETAVSVIEENNA